MITHTESSPGAMNSPPPLTFTRNVQHFPLPLNSYDGRWSSIDDAFTSQTPFANRFNRRATYFDNMAVFNPDEMEEFQKLSDQYRPELAGPLVGNKLPLTDLATEYAQADPTYVAKTQALANSYDAYRRIKGDGQCGWRGTVFGYFEVLLQSADLGFLLQEQARIKSYSEMMKSVGIAYDMLSDMFEYTFDLFTEIRKALESGNSDESVLMKFFNEENVSDSIVYHFKTMTSAYMAANADDFEPFLEMPLHEYRQTRIDPAQQEIDQIGLQGLTTGVLSLGGVAVEVLYLDRSAGDEVTPYNFAPHIAASATVRLLYRPGHYDIIYKPGPIYQQQTATQVFTTSIPDWEYGQVGDVSAFEHAVFPNSTYMPNDQAFLHQQHEHDRSGRSNHRQETGDQYYTSPTFGSVGPYHPPQVTHEEFSQHPRPQQQECFQRTQQLYPTTMPPSSMPMTSISAPTSPGTQPNGFNSGPIIRFSENMYARQRQHSIPLDPNTSASFAQNRNYYRNSNFEPECWSPEEEYNK